MLKTESTIKTFTTRVRQMILKYQELKKENMELYSMVDERDKQIAELTKKLAETEQQKNALLTAKMLNIADNDIEETKKRINKMIRTVNQCITMLSKEEE